MRDSRTQPTVLDLEDTRSVIEVAVSKHHSRQRILCGAGSLALILIAGALVLLHRQSTPSEVPREPEQTLTTTAQSPKTSASARNRMRKQLLGNESKRNVRETVRNRVERPLLAEVFGSDEKRELQIAELEPIPAFSRVSAMRAVRERRGGMAACATDAVRRGETPPTRMDVTVRILSSGRVASVAVSPERAHPVLADCAKRRIADWRFPPFRGSTQSIAFAVDLKQSDP